MAPPRSRHCPMARAAGPPAILPNQASHFAARVLPGGHLIAPLTPPRLFTGRTLDLEY
jgi:hypothetical protein